MSAIVYGAADRMASRVYQVGFAGATSVLIRFTQCKTVAMNVQVKNCNDCPFYIKAHTACICAHPNDKFIDDKWHDMMSTCPLKTEPITITLTPQP